MNIFDIKKMYKTSTTLVDGKVPFIEINNLNSQKVKAVFSTRLGGVSEGQFTSMNFCTSLGDSIENVRKNFEIFMDASGLKNVVLSKQTHTTNVKRVGKNEAGAGLYSNPIFDNVDGLVTNEKEVTLATFYADCVPLYFYDPVNEAIGLSHSGWKGTVNNMVLSTVTKMHKEFGTNASNLICAIGPSICVNCYEVSEDVATKFIETFKIVDVPSYVPNKINALDTSNIIYSCENNKYMLNLWAANYKNMINAGILPENIFLPDICTCENKDILFSHRGLNGKRGNLGAFLMLK